MIPEIQQYKEIVKNVFNRNDSFPLIDNTVYISPNLESLRKSPHEEIFNGETANGNIPKAMLIHSPKVMQFFPIMAVSYKSFSIHDDKSILMRKAVVNYLCQSEFIDINYQAVLSKSFSTYNLGRGFSSEELSELEQWVKNAFLVSKIFSSSGFQRDEEDLWDKAKVLGAGYAKLAEDGQLESKGIYVR